MKTVHVTAFAYDVLDRLIAESGFNHKLTGYHYNAGNELVEQRELGDDASLAAKLIAQLGGQPVPPQKKDAAPLSDDLENQTRFVWDGSHLLQEIHPNGRYTYIYADQDSYEPLAQVRDWTTEEGENRQQTSYFHCDHIGIPREMTDKDGNLLWFGEYDVWGKVTEETSVTGRRTSRSGFKTSIATIKRGCITISPGITTLMWVGLSTKTRLGCGVEIICTGLHRICKAG